MSGEDLEDDLVDINPEDIKLGMPSSWGVAALMEAGLFSLDIRRVGLKVNCDVRSYLRALEALKFLDAGQNILDKYQPIKQEDLGLSKDITEENRFGQSSHVLPWFWRIDGADHGVSDWNDEFLRVSWLKARARYQRWREELDMVKEEMV
ncbi:hypothetical protein JVU11DRAFT_2151 [Chiua virens]|nr:hypothetical protein JVU11DRAFT_2151 [Chiua virens]